MRFLGVVARAIDTLNEAVGVVVSWVALIMVLVQFVVVVMRYVFGIGSIVMQESVFYMHGILFMVAAGYTLLHDGHIRVDIFYANASHRWKALIDLFGVFVFLIPVCTLVWWVAWPYVAASWEVREISQEGGSGIPGVYLLKTVILVFATLLSVQGLSLAVRALFVLVGLEGAREAEQDSAGV